MTLPDAACWMLSWPGRLSGRLGGCWWHGPGRRERRCGWDRLADGNDHDLVEHDRSEGLVHAVAFDAGDGRGDGDRGGVALAEEGVVAVELRRGGDSDEELRAVGVGAGVGHGEAAGYVEAQGRGDLVAQVVAGVARPSASGSPPWIMKPGMTRWN